MAGTMFNIFGDHLTNPVHKQVLRVNDIAKENSGARKGVLSLLTPAKMPLGCCTPQATKVKKTFFQNRGAMSVGKPSINDGRASVFRSINKNSLQIYEDNAKTIPLKPKVTEEDLISIEYSKQRYFEDDEYLSDSDVVVSNENINNMIFDKHEMDIFNFKLPQHQHQMLNITMDSSDLDDTPFDDEIDLSLDLPEI